MKKVTRDQILDYVTYSENRDEIRRRSLEIKEARRIHLGAHLTFLFENTDTIRYQIQEMMRAESIVREKDIEHEIQTYNDLLGGRGELGATLLIELDDPDVRAVKLKEWVDLPKHLYAILEDGTKIRAAFDPRQIGDERLSSVQYLRFETGMNAPVALASDHPGYRAETQLSEAQRRALLEDLSSDLAK